LGNVQSRRTIAVSIRADAMQRMRLQCPNKRNRTSCVFGLEDATEQGPVHGPRLDGFGAVGLAARHALLADVDLPAAEIGGGWFHGFWFRFNEDIHKLATFSQHLLEIFHASDDYIPVANCLHDPLPPFLR